METRSKIALWKIRLLIAVAFVVVALTVHSPLPVQLLVGAAVAVTAWTTHLIVQEGARWCRGLGGNGRSSR